MPRISELDALSGLLARGDLLEIVDVSDDSISEAGASKQITVDQLLQLLNTSLKPPVRVVLPTAVSLALVTDGETFNGIELVEGDRFMTVAQTDPAENGIWVVAAGTDPPERPSDFADGLSVGGAYIAVMEGTAFADTVWMVSADPPTDIVGTDILPITRIMGFPPFLESVFALYKTADPTAQLKFDLQDIGTGQTRLIRVPNANLDLNEMATDGELTAVEEALEDAIDALALEVDERVVGPASSPDRAIAVFDGTDGKLLAAPDGPTVASTGKITVKTSRSAPVTVTFGATSTIDGDVGNMFILELEADTTIAFTNVGDGQAISLHIFQDSSGGWEVTWPAGVRWTGGVVPVVTATPDRHDWFGFICFTTGVYDGVVVGADYPNT